MVDSGRKFHLSRCLFWGRPSVSNAAFQLFLVRKATGFTRGRAEKYLFRQSINTPDLFCADREGRKARSTLLLRSRTAVRIRTALHRRRGGGLFPDACGQGDGNRTDLDGLQTQLQPGGAGFPVAPDSVRAMWPISAGSLTWVNL